MAYAVRFPDQYIELGGLPLSTAAWEVLNIEALLAGASTRGSNLVIPGAAGTRPRSHRVTERTVTLEMYVTGAFTPEGAPNADAALGLLENLEALATVLTPPATSDSLVAILLRWRGLTRSGLVQIDGYEVGGHHSPTDVPVSVDLLIPAGRLHP